MKKIISMLMSCLSLVCLSSCNSESSGGGDLDTPVFCLTSDMDEPIVLAEGRSKSVKLNVKAEKLGPAANMTFTVDADMKLVSSYNEKNSTDYVEMPASCYSFEKNSMMVYRYDVNSTTGVLKITANSLEQGKTYILPVVIASAEGAEYELTKESAAYILLKAAEVAPEEVDITAGLIDDECKPADASKTPDYTINNLEDLKNLRNNLKEGATTYVVLNADIDMASVTDWTPLFSAFNEDGTDLIEFNGKGHTISNFSCTSGSYRSFFGFLSGRVYDVDFKDANVDGTANKGTQPCAIIAAYGGNKTGKSKCAVYDVNVTGSLNGKAAGVGGIIGVAVNAIVKRCSFDGTIVNAGRRLGGIVGYHNVQIDGAYLRIEDCWTADRNAGGICGSCSYGGTYHDTELDIQKDMVIGCIAWNEKVEAKKTTTGNYSSAPVVGYCNKYQYFQNCWRKADMDFRCPITDKEFSITAVDQENSSPDMPMLGGTVEDSECSYGYKYAYPYHGKAAAAGATISSVAKQLKWNQNVWDLSGEYPVLK